MAHCLVKSFVEQGKDIAEGIEAAKILVEAGYDMLNVDAGTYDAWYWNHPPMYFEKGMYREFGKILKQNVNVPIILAGRMDNPEMACEALGTCCDIIGYGRPLLGGSLSSRKNQDRKAGGYPSLSFLPSRLPGQARPRFAAFLRGQSGLRQRENLLRSRQLSTRKMY